MSTPIEHLALRPARPADDAALRRLAGLDSARPLRGDALVAELDGVLVAALSLADGRVVADPFARTADAVELLRLRASSHGAPAGGRLARLLPAAARRRPVVA